jgi:hypothetical protein
VPRNEKGYRILTEDPVARLVIDSGAPSLYNFLSRAKQESSTGEKGHRMGSSLEQRRFDDFSYIHSPQFEAYVEAYIAFIKENEDTLDWYANIDIINNAEETYKMQKHLESKGLNPIPVYHFGEDLKWLKRYVKEYDYIALGGMVPLKESILIPGLDYIWDKFLTNRLGYPVVKVHGFAITAINLMFRYPWWSVDSTSAIVFSMYGIVLVPPLGRDGNWDYSKIGKKIAISDKSSAIKDGNGYHYENLSGFFKEKVDEYFRMIGASPEELSMSHPAREKANFQYYMAVERHKRTSPFKKILHRERFFD